MRLLWGFLALSASLTGQATASSFVHVAPPAEKISPSFIVFGEPAPAALAAAPQPATHDRHAGAKPEEALIPLAFALPGGPSRAVVISASIVAYEMPAPPVTYEQVAAIRPMSHDPQSGPVVIRGGIVGDAFVHSAAPVTLPQPGATKVASARRKPASDPASPPPAPAPVAAAPPPTRPIVSPQ